MSRCTDEVKMRTKAANHKGCGSKFCAKLCILPEASFTLVTCQVATKVEKFKRKQDSPTRRRRATSRKSCIPYHNYDHSRRTHRRSQRVVRAYHEQMRYLQIAATTASHPHCATKPPFYPDPVQYHLLRAQPHGGPSRTIARVTDCRCPQRWDGGGRATYTRAFETRPLTILVWTAAAEGGHCVRGQHNFAQPFPAPKRLCSIPPTSRNDYVQSHPPAQNDSIHYRFTFEYIAHVCKWLTHSNTGILDQSNHVDRQGGCVAYLSVLRCSVLSLHFRVHMLDACA